MSASASCLPSFENAFSSGFQRFQLFQRGDVEVAVVEVRLQARQPAREEAAILADRVAAHRRGRRRHVRREERERLALGGGFVQPGGAHALDQAALRVGALVPRVHRVEHLVGLVNHQHRPGGEHVELRVGDQRRDLDHAVGVRL